MGRLRTALETVKFEHTIFALPFAYLGMILAAGGWPTWRQFLWITVAMASARTLAMSVNRLADRALDTRNPRTAQRPLPTGQVSAAVVLTMALVSFLLYEIAAWQLNRFVLILSPLALIFLIGYHYTKRFTWLSHWILGFTDGIGVAGGWAAVRGRLDPAAILLWLAVTFWIAGFDLIYACQDVEFDRREGLYAVPARFGIATALRWASICHGLTVIFFLLVGWQMALAWPYWLGVAVVAGLLAYENWLVKPSDLSRLDVAFFNVNGYISIITFVTTLAAVLLKPV